MSTLVLREALCFLFLPRQPSFLFIPCRRFQVVENNVIMIKNGRHPLQVRLETAFFVNVLEMIQLGSRCAP